MASTIMAIQSESKITMIKKRSGHVDGQWIIALWITPGQMR
jgi:hypothetical protein